MSESPSTISVHIGASNSTIFQVVALEIFSPRGYSSFQVKIECLIHGTVQVCHVENVFHVENNVIC